MVITSGTGCGCVSPLDGAAGALPTYARQPMRWAPPSSQAKHLVSIIPPCHCDNEAAAQLGAASIAMQAVSCLANILARFGQGERGYAFRAPIKSVAL